MEKEGAKGSHSTKDFGLFHSTRQGLHSLVSPDWREDVSLRKLFCSGFHQRKIHELPIYTVDDDLICHTSCRGNDVTTETGSGGVHSKNIHI